MAGARNPNVGRRAMGTPLSTVHKPVGSGDSGGKIFNPVQKPKSNSPAAASAAPTTGMIPNTQAVGHMGGIGPAGSGKVNKKVAGIQKFYGR